MRGGRCDSLAHHLMIGGVDVPRVAVQGASDLAEAHAFMVTEIADKCLERGGEPVPKDADRDTQAWYILRGLFSGFLAGFPRRVRDGGVAPVEEGRYLRRVLALFEEVENERLEDTEALAEDAERDSLTQRRMTQCLHEVCISGAVALLEPIQLFPQL